MTWASGSAGVDRVRVGNAGVLHNQADRIDDMTMRITSCEGVSGLLRVAASSNWLIDADKYPLDVAAQRWIFAGHRERSIAAAQWPRAWV